MMTMALATGSGGAVGSEEAGLDDDDALEGLVGAAESIFAPVVAHAPRTRLLLPIHTSVPALGTRYTTAVLRRRVPVSCQYQHSGLGTPQQYILLQQSAVSTRTRTRYTIAVHPTAPISRQYQHSDLVHNSSTSYCTNQPSVPALGPGTP
eukprot:830968-Rhodomonas_salina.2